ncbi:hypothetical protein BDD12DRAFT_910596 [Trichophaea hybrida]|nr:hypothetical protein BDD12DRAFT_910596 [Trichophaea hybrida]
MNVRQNGASDKRRAMERAKQVSDPRLRRKAKKEVKEDWRAVKGSVKIQRRGAKEDEKKAKREANNEYKAEKKKEKDAKKRYNENTPFWIDSLCIPVGVEHVAIQKRAIASMGRVYSDAAKVLVLDEEPQRASCNVSYEELEGMLAQTQKLAFVSGWTASEQICFEGLGYLREIYSFKSEPLASRSAFILQAFNWRSSNKQFDEPICLGTFFDLGVKTILNTPEEDRLKRFILMQQVFPSIFLFFSSAKMDEDSFRWAPNTFVFRVATRGCSCVPEESRPWRSSLSTPNFVSKSG